MNGGPPVNQTSPKELWKLSCDFVSNFITAILINPRKNCSEGDSGCGAGWKAVWALNF
jgi:hypothetical protein